MFFHWLFLTPSTAGRLKETPKAVAMSSPSLTVFKPSVKSHLANKTTEMTKALGREDVSLKHLHVGRYKTGPTASVNRVRL